MKYIFLTFLIISCIEHKKAETRYTSEDALAKFEVYKAQSKIAEDAHGYIHNKCDGVTFTALYCIAKGLTKEECPVYGAESEDEDGRWFRHTLHDCFELDGNPGGSRSDNSRDQFVSLALLFWHYQDLESVQKIIKYGEDHDWIMGRARDKLVELSTTYWPIQFRAFYYDLLYRLGGESNPIRFTPQLYAELKDHNAHIQALKILAIGLMQGYLNEDAFKTIKEVAYDQDRNGLYRAIYQKFYAGDYSYVYMIAADESIYPKDLPTSLHRKEEYINQRDQDSADWQPDKENPPRIHSGTDYMFMICVTMDDCINGKNRI